MASALRIDIEIVRMPEKYRHFIQSRLEKMKPKEQCGICEKPGAEVSWVNPISRSAHTVCHDAIQKVEPKLVRLINTVFQDTNDRNSAHVRAVQAVKKELGGVTLKTYLDTKGEEALKELFENAGIDAAITIPPKHIGSKL